MVLWYYLFMENRKLTEAELNNLSKEMLIKTYLQLAGSFDTLQAQYDGIIRQMCILKDDIAILRQGAFGRKTERFPNTDSNQITMQDLGINILNEAESLLEGEKPDEPKIETVVVKRKRPKGKREIDLKDVEMIVEEAFTLPKEKLDELFPRGYRKLPDEIYTTLEHIPAKFIAHEYHVSVYVGNHGEGMARAKKPERLLKNSLLTPALAASIFNAKYVNAIPLYRLSDEFARHDVVISRQVMANWMITIADRYLGPVYRAMRNTLLDASVIHCDETPFKLIKDGKPGKNSKSYMWVYHSTPDYGVPPVFLYEYQPGRSSEYPKAFLKGFEGTLLTDGYQVYHKLAKDAKGELLVAGCWAHAKRKFAEIVKSVGPSSSVYPAAEEAVKRIATIYHVDNMAKGKSCEEIQKHRTESVKPLVESYFTWAEQILAGPIDKGGSLYRALKYSVNQKEYLCRFLENPKLPMDNNAAERSIRSFCVGKHNWHIIDSVRGAKASGILYSIAETAKANGLKPYDYFKYLLEQILLHIEDDPSSYIESILPWSSELPDSLKNTKKKQ